MYVYIHIYNECVLFRSGQMLCFPLPSIGNNYLQEWGTAAVAAKDFFQSIQVPSSTRPGTTHSCKAATPPCDT